MPEEKLTQEEIEEFQKLVKVIKGVDLTLEEAKEQAMRLMSLYEAVLSIDKVPNLNNNLSEGT